MRSAAVMPVAIPLAALWLTGCATVPPDRAASATGSQTSAVSKTQAVAALPPVIPCPPSGPDIIQRDLTIPWNRRAYLIEDGRLCRPGISP